MWVKRKQRGMWHYMLHQYGAGSACNLQIDKSIYRHYDLPRTARNVCLVCLHVSETPGRKQERPDGPRKRNDTADILAQTTINPMLAPTRWGRWQSGTKYHLLLKGSTFRCGVTAPLDKWLLWRSLVPDENVVCRECWLGWRQDVERILAQQDVIEQDPTPQHKTPNKMVHGWGETAQEHADQRQNYPKVSNVKPNSPSPLPAPRRDETRWADKTNRTHRKW